MKLTVEQITSTRAKWVAREIRLMANPARSTTCAKDAVELRFLIALCDLALAGLREEWVPYKDSCGVTVRTLYYWHSELCGDTYSQDPHIYSEPPLLQYCVPAAPKEPSNG